MTFEKRKEINELMKRLPLSTHVLLEGIKRWNDHADLELDLCTDLEPDDPAFDALSLNSTFAEDRVIALVRELIMSGSLAVLSELARLSRSAE